MSSSNLKHDKVLRKVIEDTPTFKKYAAEALWRLLIDEPFSEYDLNQIRRSITDDMGRPLYTGELENA